MLQVKEFPQTMAHMEIDRSDMKKCLVSGLFREQVEWGGRTRTFYTYLAPGLTYDRNCLIVAPPDDVPVLEYIENGFWREFADQEQIFLHFLEPEGRWNLDGSDADYMNQVYIQVQSRTCYVTIQDNVYAVGIGKGATVAQQALMDMTSEWSGLATFGDPEDAAMNNAVTTRQAQDMGQVELTVSASKAQLPVWMLWSEPAKANKAVKDYWKKQNDAGEERFSNEAADEIYFPSTVYKKSSVNEEKIAQVRITSHFSLEPGKNLPPELFRTVWQFLAMARRHRCYGQKALRNYMEPEAYGARLYTMEHQGFTRLWYEYVPEHVKEAGVPVPLVVCMHGRGGSAESFMDLSGLSRVAEERDFIAVFPESSIYQQRPGGIRNVLCWNGACQNEERDDVAFILKVIEDVKRRYAIDEGRIYACGQSSGGAMTSRLAMDAPRVFAAVSPWSAIKEPQRRIPLPETMDPPVPYLFLLGEHDWLCVDKDKGELEYRVTPDIAEFIRNLIRIYGLGETPRKYRCGEIQYYVYVNEKQTPMLTVGTVKDMSHANYPRESWIAYDEFFSRFSRAEDGALLYMGEPAV